MKPLYFFLCILFTSHWALGWGERGHHTSGYVAAVVASEHARPEEQKKLGGFLRERPIQMGHLNNIPDISWKLPTRKAVNRMNGPTHYFDPEILLGLPVDRNGEATTQFSEDYLRKITEIEKDFSVLRKLFEGKKNPLPGATGSRETISVYFGVGTSPWRVQDLYDSLVSALGCAGKKPRAEKKYSTFTSPLRSSEKTFTSPYYRCQTVNSRLEDIQAAVAMAGVMGHFIADMAQPFHATMDFDGWVTGQGGLHTYFESFVVHYLPESFLGDVTKKAMRDRALIWKKLAAPSGSPHFATQTMLNLTADSLRALDTLRRIDRKHALLKESEKRAYGAGPGSVEAKRKPYTDKHVHRSFYDFARDRLAISSIVLSGLWIEAWRQAGSPDLSDVDLIAIPYVLDVPFLWPAYAEGEKAN